MEDKYFNIDEMMVDYAEMTSFNFESSSYLALNSEKEVPSEFSLQKFTFKLGNYDVLDMVQSVLAKTSLVKR